MSQIKLLHSGGNGVILAAPTNNPASDVTFKLPQADGTSGQALTTNASGQLAFSTVAGGKILQVVESTSSTTVTTSGGTEADLLTLSITPSSSSNKVFLFISIDVQVTASTNAKAWVRLYRGTSSGTLIRTLKDGSEANEIASLSLTGTKLDSPNTSSAQTYTLTLARLSGGTNTVSSDGNPYFLQAMEVAA
tara:strand:+ start:150 stop:725 length:576 start_codon:yes stop_codon:yes gene_type:complete